MKQWILACRSLARRPGYTITAILVLVLGIGATTALFSVVDTVLLKPLPYPNPDRLVTVMEASPSKNQKDSLIAPVRIEDWHRMNQTFDVVSGSYGESATDTSGPEPERLAGRRVAPRYFDVYRTAPLVGRTFTAEEDKFGGPAVAVISYGLWTRRFGQDPRVTSNRLVLGGRGFSIVGVMPKDFAAASIDVWLPAQTYPPLMRQRDARFFTGIGRMKPGVTIQQAQGDLARVQRQLGEQFARTDKDWSAIVRDLKESRVGDYRRTLLLVFGAVGMLLLIAVANIAGLTLAQLHTREREMAIRSSVGASRQQVVATVMREVLLIAAAGAAFGGAAAAASVKLMSGFFTDLPRLAELRFDWRALLFAAGASLLAAIAFGLIPAVQATRSSLAAMLAEGNRSVSSGRRRLQRSLVVAQLAVTVLLLASAGLLLRSYRNLSAVDSGFDSNNTIVFHVGAAWNEDRARVGTLQERLVAELHRLPGVEAAGMTNFLPATGATFRYQIQLEGITRAEENGKFTVGSRTVSPGYLRALHAPLLAGDWCPELRMDFRAAPKALVNRRFAELYGKGENMVGRHYSPAENPRYLVEITGVVGDMREDGLAASPAPYVYLCSSAGSWPDPEYVARTKGDPRAMMGAIRQLVRNLDPNRAVFGVKTIGNVVDEALDQPRLNVRFLTLFAGSAMLLASIGLYSLVTLLVTARTREIGVRVALGARRGQIVRLVLSGAVRLLGAGVVIGLGLTLVAQRLLKTVLFGVSPLDGLTLVGAIVVLAAASTLAAFLPARRAAAIDPLEAMRGE